MKKVILTAAVGAFAFSANAQGLAFGLEAGVQLANQVQELPEQDHVGSTTTFRKGHTDGRPNIGLRAGLVTQWHASQHLSIQPALLFVMKGVRNEVEVDGESTVGNVKTEVHQEYQTKVNLNYIQLPINFQYYFGDNHDGFFLGLGPYFGYAFAGKYAADGESRVTVTTGNTKTENKTEIDLEEDISFGDNADDQFKNLDVGLGLNAGYKLASGLFVRAFGEYSFSNIYPVPDTDFETKNYGFGLTVGYLFGKKVGSGATPSDPAQ